MHSLCFFQVNTIARLLYNVNFAEPYDFKCFLLVIPAKNKFLSRELNVLNNNYFASILSIKKPIK